MSKRTDHEATGPSLLKWIVFSTPLVGLATYMLLIHHGYDAVATAERTALVVAGMWGLSYVVMRGLRWRGRRSKGPRSLPLG